MAFAITAHGISRSTLILAMCQAHSQLLAVSPLFVTQA